MLLSNAEALLSRSPLGSYRHMRRICSLSMLIWFLSLGTLMATDTSSQDYRDALDRLDLPVPADVKTREYLGLSQTGGRFSLAQIRADLVIIEIFNMYCPYCQEHAPMTNKLFQLIQGRDDLKARVKFIGIGIGNSPYEVGIFRKKFNILFPLLDDGSSSLLNSLPGIRTPHYFAVRKTGGSRMEMVFSQQGSFVDEKAFLESVLQKSGMTF
jgi:peroxiredoxin